MDALGQHKDSQYTVDLFIKVIEYVGVDSCVQIITDNATDYKDAGMIVEANPQVFWKSCIVHSLNLELKYISYDVPWIGTIIQDAQHIQNLLGFVILSTTNLCNELGG